MIHFLRNTSSNLHIYSTNFKSSNDINAVLTYLIIITQIFDVHSLRMNHKGQNKSELQCKREVVESQIKCIYELNLLIDILTFHASVS